MRKSLRAALLAVRRVLDTRVREQCARRVFIAQARRLEPDAAGRRVRRAGSDRRGRHNADDPTARVAIYIPSGYQIATEAPGTKLGEVTATAAAADLGGAILPLTGELDAVDPATLTAAQKQGISLCLAGATASQTWVLHLTAAGQTLDVPMMVVPTAGPEATVGQAKLLVCLPPPDVPVGSPGRAQFGAKLLSATFGVNAITQPASSGDFTWTSLFTPYNPGVGTVNAAGSRRDTVDQAHPDPAEAELRAQEGGHLQEREGQARQDRQHQGHVLVGRDGVGKPPPPARSRRSPPARRSAVRRARSRSRASR